MTQKHTVIVILEALPEKQDELKQALIDVAKSSRAEEYCIEYRLHQNKENPNQFVLYENWPNAELHAKQFEKSYIKTLGKNLETLLAKPFEYITATELQ